MSSPSNIAETKNKEHLFPYKRVLLKLSGEVFGSSGIDYANIAKISEQILLFHKHSIELAVVIGGGNILRGEEAAKYGMERATADYMGMLATIINALALQEACEKNGMITRVLSAISVQNVAENYVRRRAMRHLEKKRIIIFAAGIGNPYFTTDTTAALRAIDMDCEIIVKATKVDGVYDSDPNKNKDARRLKEISYMEAIKANLKIMDLTALTLCMENKKPITVFDIFQKDNLNKLLDGEEIGTYISGDSKLTYA